eukprot:1019641-Ditylum_brightwellii.AAC.1
MIKKAMIRYICWKWWCAPESHGKGMSTTISYELYMDCESGKLVADWKMDNPMTYCDFCLHLGEQMMTYYPKNRHYQGDSSFRSATQLPKKHCAKMGKTNNKPIAEDYIETQRSGQCCSNSYKEFARHMPS